jgi:hypothetical protein
VYTSLPPHAGVSLRAAAAPALLSLARHPEGRALQPAALARLLRRLLPRGQVDKAVLQCPGEAAAARMGGATGHGPVVAVEGA